jgi:hypothetical protein
MIDFEGYLQFATRDGDYILLNGEDQYKIPFPKVMSKQAIENSLFEGCQKHNLDYVSPENVRKRAIEIMKQYHWPRPTRPMAAENPKEPDIELTEDLTKEVTFVDVGEILSTSIKKDYAAKMITYSSMLLAQTRDDQINVGFQSESSAGKSYIPVEIASYFPGDEVVLIASASPTAFFHDGGTWDDQRKCQVVDLEGKILIFQDQPHFLLLERLRPLLSHDARELQYKITDKNEKHGLRTKNVIVKGYPAVVFCTTKMDPDEQEKTRMLLLSPSIDQDKLRQSLRLISLRKGNPDEYAQRVIADPSRKWLKLRIMATRQSHVNEVIIPNHEHAVCERFLTQHKHLVARHQRDFPRILSLIKAHALLNCFNRQIQNGINGHTKAVVATQADIDAGFELYKEIELSNELGLSPHIFRIYRDVILPRLSSHTGITREEIQQQYYEIFHKALSPETLKREIIPELETVGLIRQDPDPTDKRRLLIYPTVSTPIISGRINELETKRDRGCDSGVKQTLDWLFQQ